MQRKLVTSTPNKADALILEALGSVTDLDTYCIGQGYTDQRQSLDVKLLDLICPPSAVMLTLVCRDYDHFTRVSMRFYCVVRCTYA
jgi:hypothetical protein